MQCNVFETFRKFTACFCFFFNKQLVETLPRKLSPFCFLYKYHPVHFFMLHMQHFNKYALNFLTGFYVYNRDNDACKYHSDTDIITHAMSNCINALGGCIAHDVK